MKNLLLVLAFGFMTHTASAQYSLTFCEDVNSDGKAKMPSNSFQVDKNGSVLKLLLKSDGKMNTAEMDYKVFYIDDSGKEEEISKFPQQVQPDWNFAWKEVVFFDPGNYRIKVYTADGTYLTSANLNVKQQL